MVPPSRREINERVYHWNMEGNLTSTICQKGKPSKTYLKVLAHLGRNDQEFSLVAIRICTGRRHQIRTHTTHIGHPIVCDGKYTAPAVFLADLEWLSGFPTQIPPGIHRSFEPLPRSNDPAARGSRAGSLLPHAMWHALRGGFG